MYKTQGKRLAIGDIKAILARLVGRDEAVDIIKWAGNGSLSQVNTAYHDATEFDHYRNSVWTALRYDYPTHPDLNKLQGESISDAEHQGAYYQTMKRKWKMETDKSPNESEIGRCCGTVL